MSYSIYYDRAFIRVDDRFIPLANSGSSNCFESGLRGHWRCEKSWNVLNWPSPKQFMFTEAEIRDIACIYDQYNQESGMIYKSRNRCFAPGEFEKWITSGMTRAYTVEEYVSFGNEFYVLDYSADEIRNWQKHPFRTTDELTQIINDLKDVSQKEVKLLDNREVYRPKSQRQPKKKLNAAGLPEYYVLKGEYEGHSIYFVELTRRGGFRYILFCPYGFVKVFPTEKDALKYLKQYHDRLVVKYGFEPERITNAA